MRRARGPWGWWLRPGQGRPGVFLSSHDGILLVVSGEPLGRLYWASSISALTCVCMCMSVRVCTCVLLCGPAEVCECVHVTQCVRHMRVRVRVHVSVSA